MLVRHRGEGSGRYIGDLLDENSLSAFLRGSRCLINLVDPQSDAERALRSLARAARDAGVERVVHLSTATVVGRCRDQIITEQSKCDPRHAYEARKLRAEETLREELGAAIDFGILRPTAIVGAGSRNLRKLADDIVQGPEWKLHLLRFLHGHREMHLVPVEAVVAALLFLVESAEPLCGEAFILSSEGDPLDHYQPLDAHLGALLGRPQASGKRSAPPFVLGTLLRLAGRSLIDPRQRFSSEKLRQRGFRAPLTLAPAIAAFAKEFRPRGKDSA